jgi:5'-phosphate synthase pdxT subunit
VPRIGVLALQGDVVEHLRMLEESGAQALRVRRPEELCGLRGLVVPGGESTTIAKLARTFEVFEPLRLAIKAGLPVYGSCAGLILLADRVADGTADQETFGGLDILVRRNAFGRQVDSFEADLALDADIAEPAPKGAGIAEPAPKGAGIAEPAPKGAGIAQPGIPFRAVFIRAPWVEETGPEVQVLGRVHHTEADGALGRIVAVRQGNLLATSFHPELTGDDRVHRYFVDLVRNS